MTAASRKASVKRGTGRSPPRANAADDDAKSDSEKRSQFTLQMRASLHRDLARRAFNSGMTMRGYIMEALRKSGLKVTEADLVDRRRREE